MGHNRALDNRKARLKRRKKEEARLLTRDDKKKLECSNSLSEDGGADRVATRIIKVLESPEIIAKAQKTIKKMKENPDLGKVSEVDKKVCRRKHKNVTVFEEVKEEKSAPKKRGRPKKVKE